MWIGGAGALVRPAQSPRAIIPIDICLVFPRLGAPQPSLTVNWLNCGNQNGFVLVGGKNFAANSTVQADVGNCQGPFSVPVGASTDANGSFVAWVACNCGGSTTVNASDTAGNVAEGTAAMPC
jgi:hypothetical protein